MDRKPPEYPQAQGPVGYAFLSRREVSLFRRLIEDRRSLPVFRAGGWLCYECAFASADLAAMVQHIRGVHRAVPANEDDQDQDDHDQRLTRRREGPFFAHRLSHRCRGPMNGKVNSPYMLVATWANQDGPRQPVVDTGKRAAP